MITRKLVVTVAAGFSLFATPAYAQDADKVSDWLLQNKVWTYCLPERVTLPRGGSVVNPLAFPIDPLVRTKETRCIISGPYNIAPGPLGPHDPHSPPINWYLQAVSNISGPCRLNVNAKKTSCTLDVIRACTI